MFFNVRSLSFPTVWYWYDSKCVSLESLWKSGQIFLFLASSALQCRCVVPTGRPVMIVVEFMENGALDSFLRVKTHLCRLDQTGKDPKSKVNKKGNKKEIESYAFNKCSMIGYFDLLWKVKPIFKSIVLTQILMIDRQDKFLGKIWEEIIRNKPGGIKNFSYMFSYRGRHGQK